MPRQPGPSGVNGVPALTPRQEQVLAFIARCIERDGLPPTRAEICHQLGFRSPNAAEAHLRALARKGAIELRPGASRGIRLLSQTPEPGLPVVGRVAAGQPILAEQHIEDRHPVPPGLFRPAADYLLRVRGASMRDAGILDGDLLAVHAQPTADDGQVVVARVEDEVTVKRYRRHGHRVTLLPENPEFTVIEVDMRQCEFAIEGLAVGVLRTRVP